MKPSDKKIQRSVIKWLIFLIPVALFLILLCIYGEFVIKIMNFISTHKPARKPPPKHILFNSSRFLVGNFSLKNRNDFYVKMQVIHDKNVKMPEQQDCGIAYDHYSKRRTRIVRGKEAEPNSFPWMASLKHFRNNVVQEHFCAGSLIYEKYILTAAHCLTGLTKNDFVVVLGLHNLNDTSETAIANTYKVTDIIKHENYLKKDPNFDIALIKLDKTVTRSRQVWPICLPNSKELSQQSIIDKYATVAGWGRSNPYSQPKQQRNLQNTKLKIINGQKLCSKHLESFDYTNLYCAHDTDLKKNSNVCIGDSGGPLMISHMGRYYNYGIISFVFTFLDTDGNWKCYTQAPSYFLKVIKFLNWITDSILHG